MFQLKALACCYYIFFQFHNNFVYLKIFYVKNIGTIHSLDKFLFKHKNKIQVACWGGSSK